MDMDAASPQQILKMRLVHISDELRALPADAFAEKHELNLEADEIRKALSEVEGDQSEALAKWAERAGRKGIPMTDDEQRAAGQVQAKGGPGKFGSE